MFGRAQAPALGRAVGPEAVRRMHWRAVLIPSDWISAHRAARIDARCNLAREEAFRRMQGHRRCG